VANSALTISCGPARGPAAMPAAPVSRSTVIAVPCRSHRR
jgi:hypothetical protein